VSSMTAMALRLPIKFVALALIATSQRSEPGDEDSNTSHVAKDSNTSIVGIEMHNSTAVVGTCGSDHGVLSAPQDAGPSVAIEMHSSAAVEGTRGSDHGVLSRVDQRILASLMKILTLILAVSTVPVGDVGWDREFDGSEQQAIEEFKSYSCSAFPWTVLGSGGGWFGTASDRQRDSVSASDETGEFRALPVKKPKTSKSQASKVTPFTNKIIWALEQIRMLFPAKSKKNKRTVAGVKFFSTSSCRRCQGSFEAFEATRGKVAHSLAVEASISYGSGSP